MTRRDHTRIPRAYIDRIVQVHPHLRRASLELIDEGLANDVILVDRTWVCRFAKHAWANETLQHEHRVLDLVRPHLHVPVPHFEHIDDGFVSYRYLEGEPLTRSLLLHAGPKLRSRLIRQLAGLLRDLHSVPLAHAEAAGIRGSETNRSAATWTLLYHSAQETLYPHLWRHQRTLIDEHFRPVVTGELDLSHPAALVNGDLAPYHLLVDRRKGRLAGVIDFGTAGIGDPAADLAVFLYHYGEFIVREILALEPSLREHIDRARFWAGALEVQWALAGIKQNDRAFQLAHLGGARDLMPVGFDAGERPIEPDRNLESAE